MSTVVEVPVMLAVFVVPSVSIMDMVIRSPRCFVSGWYHPYGAGALYSKYLIVIMVPKIPKIPNVIVMY